MLPILRTPLAATISWRGAFYCPACRRVQLCEKKVLRTLLRFLLVRYGKADEFVECGVCKGAFAPEVLEEKPESLATKRRVSNEIRDIVVYDLLRDSNWREEFVEFRKAMESHGFVFSSPGRSVQRLVINLAVDSLVGDAPHPYLRYPDVKSALRPFLVEFKDRGIESQKTTAPSDEAPASR